MCGPAPNDDLAPDDPQIEGASNSGLSTWDENQDYIELEFSISVSLPYVIVEYWLTSYLQNANCRYRCEQCWKEEPEPEWSSVPSVHNRRNSTSGYSVVQDMMRNLPVSKNPPTHDRQ